ncbi:MAG: type IV secretory system conjugative DNA transfer family protein [Methylorubrum rhodinum]|uniref:type IV secretory system conjugative DNA transfer family protein n=1 Tax=Methylorubrum rhodinum TaxID=29428 RepID=UPI003BB1E18B
MRLDRILLTTALCTLPHAALAQVANTYCAGNPAACQPVASAYTGYAPNGFNGGYPPNGGYNGGYAPNGFAPNGYGGGYAPNGYGGYVPNGYPGYGGYPQPGYYPNGQQLQGQSLSAITYGPNAQPGQDGNSPFPQNQPLQANAPVPPHPANAHFNRYSAGVFSDANRPSKVVQRTARTAGIRDGYIEESKRIADHLASPEIAARLVARYSFASVMVNSDVVPPVITELRAIRQTPARNVLNTTLGSFEIVRTARMTVTTPNWRDYLTVVLPAEPAPTWMPPQTDNEKAHWDVSYKAGLEIGVAQARAAFDDGLARLDRDISGMRRYHDLAQRGVVSLPVVKTAAKRLKISRDGRSAAVGNRSMVLTVSPKFQRTASAAAGG